MSHLNRIAKGCVCGLCIGFVTCVDPITVASDKHCEHGSICRAVVPEQPHGGENEPKAPAPTGKVTLTAVTSTSSAPEAIGPNYPAVRWRKT
jgi:hypothetical protein